jgi:hypothetical protein
VPGSRWDRNLGGDGDSSVVGRPSAVHCIHRCPPELEGCWPGIEGDGGWSGKGRGRENKDTEGCTLGCRVGPDLGIQRDGWILALIPVVIPIVANRSAATNIRAVAMFAGKLAEAIVVHGRVKVVARLVCLSQYLNQDASRSTGASVDGAEAKMASKVAEALKGAGTSAPSACRRQKRQVSQNDAVVRSLAANIIRAVPVVAVKLQSPAKEPLLLGRGYPSTPASLALATPFSRQVQAALGQL